MGPAVLQQEAARLALVTIHCQVPLGYVGIAYLRVAQARKNRLLDVGRGQLGAADMERECASALRLGDADAGEVSDEEPAGCAFWRRDAEGEGGGEMCTEEGGFCVVVLTRPFSFSLTPAVGVGGGEK